MASKKKHGAGGEMMKAEDPLQAVLLADSFNVRFAPVTKQIPRALMPICNVSLLEYTLEFLANSGVQEVMVYCCAHAEQIKAYLKDSKWSNPSLSCKIRPIVSEDCMSVGDALRDLYGKSLIRSDFVLVNGDLISNLNLKSLIQEHKERREKDKSSAMTMVFKEAAPHHRSRCLEDDVILAVASDTQRVLHYKKVGDKKKISFPLEIFKENTDIKLRYDLLDCQISICAPVVPAIFSDNFDYQTRNDFVKGLLDNEEIMGNSIHLKVIKDDYAVRVTNLPMYDAVSKDILNRWSYPMVPDNNLKSEGTDRYIYGRHNIYLSDAVKLSRGSKLEENVMVGSDSTVGKNTRISHSTIGKNCKIGMNVKITGAYIWDNVTVEDNCNITSSLICSNATIKHDVTIEAGCVLSFDVVVGPSVVVPGRTSLIAHVESDDDFEDDSDEDDQPKVAKVMDNQLVGEEGRAYRYTTPVNSDDECDDLVQDIWGLAIHSDNEPDQSESELSSDDMNSDAESDDQMVTKQPEEDDDMDDDDDSKLFYTELLDTLDRAKEEDLTADNIILEINSLKHAYNITIKEVNQGVIRAIGEFPLTSNPDLAPGPLMQALKPLLNQWLDVMKNYIKSAEAQKDCLIGLEELSLQNPSSKAVLMQVLHYLYNKEILEEGAILSWYENIPSGKEDARKDIRQSVTKFIHWLEEADEESSDED